MKHKHHFRLERVLRVRAILERVARAQFGAAQSELHAAEATRDGRSRALASSRQELGQGVQAGAITPGRALLVERLMDAQMFGLSSASEQVLTKSASADRLAADWRLSEQERQALLELKQRAQTKHRLAVEAEENKEMDEQAIGRVTRMRQLQRESAPEAKDSEIYSRSRPPSTE